MSDKREKGGKNSNGEENGDCQECGMMSLARGPCSDAFLNAYTCFIRSEEDVKGSDCFDKMTLLTKCWTAYNPDDIAEKRTKKKTSTNDTQIEKNKS